MTVLIDDDMIRDWAGADLGWWATAAPDDRAAVRAWGLLDGNYWACTPSALVALYERWVQLAEKHARPDGDPRMRRSADLLVPTLRDVIARRMAV